MSKHQQKELSKADAERHAWWAYCEANQRTLPTIPTFEEWKALLPVLEDKA